MGEDALRELIRQYPDTPEADSARRLLGESVPERPEDFYAAPARLASLASALPEVADPMLRISDQLDRYAAAREARERQEVRASRERDRREPLRPPGEPAPGAPGTQEEPPTSPGRPPAGLEP